MAAYELNPPEKDLLTSRTTFPQQRLKGPHQDEYIRVLVFPKSHSHCSNPELRCISQIQTSSLKRESLCPTLSTSVPGNCTKETSPQDV